MAYSSPNSILGGSEQKEIQKQKKKAAARKRRQAIRAAKREVKQATKSVTQAKTHPHRYKVDAARRAVLNYTAPMETVDGTKYLPKQRVPTAENIRLAFDSFTPQERKRIAPKLVQRAANSATGKRNLPDFLRQYAPKTFDDYAHFVGSSAREYKSGVEQANSDLGRAVEIGLTVAPVGKIIQVGSKAWKAKKAADAAKAAKAASVAEKGATGLAKSRTVRVAEKVAPKTSAKVATSTRAAKTAVQGSRAAKAARVAGGTRAGRAAIVTAKAGGKTAKTTAKVATLPIRKPIKTTGTVAGVSVAAQTPAVIATGDPEEFLKPITEGTGAVPDLIHKAGEKLDDFGVLGNAARDLLELPAAALPSTYLLGKGLKEAAQGDDSLLKEQLNGYLDQGLLPAIFKGDVDQALAALKEHPIFSALELRGGQAAVGRTAGKTLRLTTGGRVGSTARAPLEIEGMASKPRSYSGDIIEKAVQKAADKRRAKKQGGQKATEREVRKILNERGDRIVAAEEGARRIGRSQTMDAAKNARPKRSVDQDGVSLAAQGIVRSVRTFAPDLERFAAKLDDSRDKLIAIREDSSLPKAERAAASVKVQANRRLHKQVIQVMKKGDAETIMASAAENVGTLRGIDKDLADLGLLSERQAQQARLISFARAHLDARYGRSNETQARMNELKAARKDASPLERKQINREIRQLQGRKQVIDKDGNALPPERLEQLRKQMGAQETAFVTHRPQATGSGSFYRQMWPERQSLGTGKRTGQATDEGTFDASYQALAEQAIRGRGIVDAAKGFDRTIRSVAVRNADGSAIRFKNFRDARDAARDPEEYGIPVPAGQELVPIRLSPFRAKKGEQARAEEIHDRYDEEFKIADSLSGKLTEAQGKGPGPVVLVPRTAVKRLEAHFKPAGEGQKAVQAVNQAFKGTVLPTSVKWLAGNVADINVRTMLDGNLPFGWGFDRRLMKNVLARVEELDPDTANRIRAGITPGAHMGSQEAQRMFRSAQQFEGTALAPFARGMQALRNKPGPKQVVDLYVKYRDGIFALNDRFIERPGQEQLLGKALRRDLQETTGKWHNALMVGEDALNDLAKGLLKTENQIKYAKQVEEVLGQWTANSPTARALLVSYAPFGMWTRAATKFVFWTLPAKHPIKTAILAGVEQMTEEERKTLGLSFFADRPVPDNLQGALPEGDGGLRGGVTGLTTFGYFGNYGNAVSTAILPQFSGAIDSLRGLDWTGQRLEHEDGTPLSAGERALAALTSTGEAYIPFLGVGQRYADKGPASLDPRGTPLEPEIVDWLRDQAKSQTITVPAEGSGSSSSSGSGLPWAGSSSGSSGGSSLPWAGGG